MPGGIFAPSLAVGAALGSNVVGVIGITTATTLSRRTLHGRISRFGHSSADSGRHHWHGNDRRAQYGDQPDGALPLCKGDWLTYQPGAVPTFTLDVRPNDEG